jgi:hypothetical protein
MSATIMRATLEAHTYVPAGSLIRSGPDAWNLRLVSAKEKKYMAEVLDATNRLREDYKKIRNINTVG